jgi:hypothetical protein
VIALIPTGKAEPPSPSDGSTPLRIIWRDVCLIFSAFWACCLFSSYGELEAQEPETFIGTIDRIKQAIGPVTCPHAMAERTIEIGAVHGTAVFVDAHGLFLTAAHVIKGLLGNKECETPAVFVPLNKWTLDTRNIYALQFAPANCKIDETADLARCRTVEDPTEVSKIVSKPTAVTIESDVQPDGTAVAFSGFPVTALIPYTTRAYIAGYQAVRVGTRHDPEVFGIVLDKSAWVGASGAPVYRLDGRVIGIMLQRGTGDATGLAFARHGARVNEFLNAP